MKNIILFIIVIITAVALFLATETETNKETKIFFTGLFFAVTIFAKIKILSSNTGK